MQEDERDLLEVLIFDEIEETVGTWLRAIIQRLGKEQTAIRRDHRKRPTPNGKTLRGTLLYQKRRPKSQSRRVRLRWTGGKFFRFRLHPISAPMRACGLALAAGDRNPHRARRPVRPVRGSLL